MSLSHAALINTILDYPLIGSKDIIFAFSTIYWLSAWFFLLTGTFRGATRIITRNVFSPRFELDLIEKHKISAIFNTPHQLTMLLKDDGIDNSDLSTVAVLIVSGTKFLSSTKVQLQKYLNNAMICDGYGMSEVAGYVSCEFGVNRTADDAVGQLLNGFAIKIVNENGNRCDVDVDGEICIKTKFKFLGYYGNREATDDLFDDEGFVRSGDIGHFDGNGNLFIVDRKKDLLKYCTFPIAPSEIEDFLIQLPAISSACVVGIPDPVTIDLPAAVIVRSENGCITEEEVFNLVAGKKFTSQFVRL